MVVALAGECRPTASLLDVVGVQQRARRAALVRHVQRQHRRPATCGAACSSGSGRARRPPSRSDLGHRRLLRGRVEHLTRAGRGSRAPRHRTRCATFSAAPSTTAQSSPGRQRTASAVVDIAQPNSALRPSRIAQGGGQLGVVPVRRPEVRSSSASRYAYGPADQARATGHRAGAGRRRARTPRRPMSASVPKCRATTAASVRPSWPDAVLVIARDGRRCRRQQSPEA